MDLVGKSAAFALLVSSGAAMAATPDATVAATGYTYFNRPAASAADYEREVAGCIGTAVGGFVDGGLTKRGEIRTTADPLFGGIAPGLIFSMANQVRLQVSLQNCMAVAGWRVMRLDDAHGAALWQADRAEIARQLQAWAGAEQPPGEVVRTYENDAARRGAVVFAIHTLPQLSVRSLSLKAFDPSKLQVPKVGKVRYANAKAKFMAQPLDAAAVRAVPSTEALAIFSFSGKSSSKYDFLQARRFGPTPEVLAWDADGRPDEFFLWGEQKHPLSKTDREVYAVALPPGRWRILSRSALELCLGAPAFEAKAGEVIYLGHFDLDAGTLSPDLSLESLPAGLPITLEQRARLRPAAWLNGARWPCFPAVGIFAMEFPGLPAEPGYRAAAVSAP
ncbi:MAG: hypothetical protein C0481_02790 [Phenylobacterium sp.]|uniref:hypothetical protein n=1 Tax=Phenylobacterium sp. TaxID=1871053 RepID=UPI0025FD82DD|nr:hypothetical protein [Phenylobacterium sp.]MBA4010771.1 hypothetical protein [Phenylobacterium sp.]